VSAEKRQRRAVRYEEELPGNPHVSDEADVKVEQSDDAPQGSAALPLHQSVLATNTGVRLACTMAAMMGLFALFLCWAEKESRVIRRFAVQSAALTAAHVIIVSASLILTALLGGIPFLGVLITLLCWLCYIAVLTLLIVTRVRLMEKAWRGLRYDLPPFMERLIARYY